MIGAANFRDLLQAAGDVVAAVGMYKIDQPLAQQFLGGTGAQQSGAGGIDINDPSAALHSDSVGGEFDQLPVSLFTFSQRTFRLAALADVAPVHMEEEHGDDAEHAGGDDVEPVALIVAQ